MPHIKKEQVYEDSIVLFYNNNWYDISYTGLVAIEAAQNRYGLQPSTSLFIPLGMITPYAPKLENGHTADYVVYPDPPAITDAIAEEMRVKLFLQRVKKMNSTIFTDLRLLIEENSTEFTDLLTDSLMP